MILMWSNVFSLVCFMHLILNCLGKNAVYLNVTRQNDGDFFTRITSNIKDSSCERWFAVNVSAFSRKNCTVQCKCKDIYSTYSIAQKKCVNEDDIMKDEKCNGSFLPSFGKPLYDLSKPGQAQLNVSLLTNQSDCRISAITYFNGTSDAVLSKTEFNLSRVQSGSALLLWNSSILSEFQQFGFLVTVRLLCNDMTSRPQRSCFMLKTRGRINVKIDSTTKEHQELQENCDDENSHSNVMLLYLLVGVGCGFVLVAFLVACFACYTRRRRLANPRNSSRVAVGTRKTFKTRSVTKNNGPTTPAIHDVIFNELSWDNDGGFSNRALADPRILEADYGIPVDFGTLPRPESSTSFDSNRNSLSPLTNLSQQR